MGDLFESRRPSPATLYPALFAGGPYKLDAFLAELPLQQRKANMYGKVVHVPRLECWHGSRPYAFGGRVEHPQPWGPLTLELKAALERAVGHTFDSCFANYYRTGDDYIPWHADDEPWIGPVIASVTFGGARRFVLRHNETREVIEWPLGDGDVLLMHAGTQQAWQHTVPRTAKPARPRLNLTFRQTISEAR